MLIADNLSFLDTVNRCQVAELKKAASEVASPENCASFHNHVRNVQSAVIHTYQLTAFASIQEADPKKAAVLWEGMVAFCDYALAVLREMKGKYQGLGALELYDLVLDYRGQSHKRYIQNLQDSEWQTIPAGLFAKTT